MRTREQLIHLRIVHVVIMITTAFFAYQYSNWPDALWIPISVLAIIGPFSPGLSIGKAKQRMIGSIAGLLLSVIIWLFLQYNPNLLPIIAVVLIYCLAFCILQEYTYFIMLVSVMLCVNYDYMNLFFKTEITFLSNRAICVLTGIFICQFYEYFIFKHSYNNAVSLVESERLDKLIVTSWDCFNSLANKDSKISPEDIDLCINPILIELSRLRDLKNSFVNSYSKQDETLKLIARYEEKLNSIYYWISSQGYAVLNRKQEILSTSRYDNIHEEELCN